MRRGQVNTELNYVDEYPDEIDVMIDLNDRFTLYDIIKKASKGTYRTKRGLDVMGVIDDLRRCMVFSKSSPEIYVLKCYDSVRDIQTVSYNKKQAAIDMLDDIVVGEIKVGKKLQDVRLWDVFFNNQKLFMVRGLKFYSEDPEIYSYFNGYPYETVDKINMDLIQPFLNHTREVIANGNEKAYQYILKWTASIFQKPAFKTSTVILIIGDQGTGKTTYSDVICKMMGRYANNNVTQLGSLTGQFNTVIENKKLIVLNELQSIDGSNNRKNIADALKSIISDKTININAKFKDEKLTENVANFIMISNHAVPVNIEGSDRRFLALNTSNAHRQDYEYFNALYSKINEDGFYENLFTYFMQEVDISNFNVYNIPDTEAKKDIQDACMSSWDAFIRSEYRQIINLSSDGFYNMYKEYCDKNSYSVCNKGNFLSYTKKYTGGSKPRYINKVSMRVYNILDEYREKFAREDEEKNNASKGEKVSIERNELVEILRKVKRDEMDKDELLYELLNRYNIGISEIE